MIKNRANPPPPEQDIKSRIIFQSPQANALTVIRNRSYSNYKQQCNADQNRNKPQGEAKTDRQPNLTIENIKKKYGFVSKPSASFEQPLQMISNRQKETDIPKPSINDLKLKYSSKKGSTPNILGDSENQSMVLEKYKVQKKRQSFGSISNAEWLNKLSKPPVSKPPMSNPKPPELSTDPNKMPVHHSDITPNFSDQMKTRNKEWLENLDRVQDKIRAVLER